MNKKEILEEIKKTKQHLADVKRMLEEYEYRKWEPEIGERYYGIGDGLKIYTVANFDYPRDRNTIKAYGCFETEKQAEQEAEKILVRRQLEDIAKRLNKERRIDWDDFEQSKYNVGLYNGGIVASISFSCKIQGAVYCLDENFKNIAIQEIGEERLRNYLRGK